MKYCFILTTFLTASLTASAQTNKAQSLALPPPNVVIDGNLREWGDSLRYYNEDKKLNYTLANDNDNLYAVIRFNDRLEQARVLNAGFTLSIDTKGKKKETFKMTFPLRYPGAPEIGGGMRDSTGEFTKEDRDELIRARLTTLRSIKVEGFKDVEDPMISTSNTYGFKAAVNYDGDGNLVCEAAIPLKFFHADNVGKNEWAFNFKINGMQKPDFNRGGNQGGDMPGGNGMGGGRGGMGGGRGGRGGGMGGGRGGMGYGGAGGNMSSSTSRGELFKSEDFWTKFTPKS